METKQKSNCNEDSEFESPVKLRQSVEETFRQMLI